MGLSLIETQLFSLVLRQFDHGRSLLDRHCCHLGLQLGKILLKPLSFLVELLFGLGRLALPCLFCDKLLGAGYVLLRAHQHFV
jgi:hypothetical protein